MISTRYKKYGFIKPAIDAHTMGVNTAAELVKECGYAAMVAPENVAKAMNEIKNEENLGFVIRWIQDENIERIGLSYRLDEEDALVMVGFLVEGLKKKRLLKFQGGKIDSIFFAGLPNTCKAVDQEFQGLVTTFKGGESVTETLLKMGVAEEDIPKEIAEGNKYDEQLMSFGRSVIQEGAYVYYKPLNRKGYRDFGTNRDTIVKRITEAQRNNALPLTRAHVGPYDSRLTRKENVIEFLGWARILADTEYLDVLSIGSSQLTQSNFGENWEGQVNGGGVPVNSELEYREIYEASRPLLVRTYAGTKNIPTLAKIHEDTLNISWHALSLWWFNKLDERGPYDLYTNLQQHMETISYIAKTNKPFEANVSHHFAFRGADDATYIVSAYLAAKLAKKLGVKTYILQNMLNTPRFTWGIQDLAKSRVLLELIRDLEGDGFKVYLQPRAGLDYFKPDLEEAKAQLAAVSALMDDIEPYNSNSPEIVHVVSYSEASHLATPDVINESIQITQYALKKYRAMKKNGMVEDMGRNKDVLQRVAVLKERAKKIIETIENTIEDPYTPEGFYLIFAAGFLPVPYLWGETSEFEHAKNFRTKPVRGSVKIVNERDAVVSTQEFLARATNNLSDAKKALQARMIQRLIR